MNGPNQVIVMNGFRAPEIDVFLSRLLDAPIVNRTGIPDTASFSFVLEFVPDDSLGPESLEQFASGDRQIASDPSTVPRAPGIVTALEEQLGLRLERVRAPREFIVIDASSGRRRIRIRNRDTRDPGRDIGLGSGTRNQCAACDV